MSITNYYLKNSIFLSDGKELIDYSSYPYSILLKIECYDYISKFYLFGLTVFLKLAVLGLDKK